MTKGKIQVPRDYQERIVKYLVEVGDDFFTVRDCATATGIPFDSVRMSFRGRRQRGELEGVLVDGVWLYEKKDDPKIMKVPPGLVAELVWAVLKDAGSEELTFLEIARRIAAQRPELCVGTQVVSNDLLTWRRLGHLCCEGKRGQYRYRLTDAARALPERPVLQYHTGVPRPQTVSQ